MKDATDALDKVDLVVRIWVRLLGELSGLTEVQVRRWAENWRPVINNPTSGFFHETLAYYVTPLLLPDSMRGTTEFEKILERITNALEMGGSGTQYLSSNYDWNAARNMVNDVLIECGSSLEEASAALCRRFDP